MNWQRQQAGNLVDEFRTTRHAVTEVREYTGREYVRRAICTGSGILVAPAAVTAREKVGA